MVVQPVVHDRTFELDGNVIFMHNTAPFVTDMSTTFFRDVARYPSQTLDVEPFLRIIINIARRLEPICTRIGQLKDYGLFS